MKKRRYQKDTIKKRTILLLLSKSVFFSCLKILSKKKLGNRKGKTS